MGINHFWPPLLYRTHSALKPEFGYTPCRTEAGRVHSFQFWLNGLFIEQRHFVAASYKIREKGLQVLFTSARDVIAPIGDQDTHTGCSTGASCRSAAMVWQTSKRSWYSLSAA